MNREGVSLDAAGRDPTGSVEAAGGAEAAIPPTGGVPPQDAPAAFANKPVPSSSTEDLVDGLDLMLRAARKLSGTPDAELEQFAERVLRELQQLDAANTVGQDASGQQLAALCAEAARELRRVIEAVAIRVESVFAQRSPFGA